jgi:hypothetical protein
MRLEQAIVAPETQVAVRSSGRAVMARAADVENPATAVGHPTAAQTDALSWSGAGCRLGLSANQGCETARSEWLTRKTLRFRGVRIAACSHGAPCRI